MRHFIQAITGRNDAKLFNCAPGWMPSVIVCITNYHDYLSPRRIKLRQMVTLAYIHSYNWLAPGFKRPLADGNVPKYSWCADRGDNTCPVLLRVMIEKARKTKIICCVCLHTNKKQQYLDLTQNWHMKEKYQNTGYKWRSEIQKIKLPYLSIRFNRSLISDKLGFWSSV